MSFTGTAAGQMASDIGEIKSKPGLRSVQASVLVSAMKNISYPVRKEIEMHTLLVRKVCKTSHSS